MKKIITKNQKLKTSFRMPAEWEPHQGTLLTWPHDGAHWPGLFETVPSIWARIVRELEVGEEVHIITHNEEVETSAKEEMLSAGVMGKNVRLHRIPSNFSWARDHGPTVVKNENGERLLLDWQYNAWGNQWNYELDDDIPTQLAEDMGLPSKKVPMVLEGGSIDVNGIGTLLTTEHCLLNPNRNPGMTKREIEERLSAELGTRNILWLGEGILGDDTSGHVDDLARFVGPRTVVTIVCDDPDDPDYRPLQENLRRLRSMTDQDGNPLDIITIPQPKPVLVYRKAGTGEPSEEGFRIPASYANFYIGNECVLLPVWNDANDAAAIEVMKKCFPTRRIVPIDSRVLTWGWGSFHCLTQQIPA